jgi:hypothetical protein
MVRRYDSQTMVTHCDICVTTSIKFSIDGDTNYAAAVLEYRCIHVSLTQITVTTNIYDTPFQRTFIKPLC